MAGAIFQKEIAAVTLQDATSLALSNAAQVAAATTLDNRSSGNGAESFRGTFQLTGGFGSGPSVGANVDLYLVPALDGSTYATVDASGHVMPSDCFIGSFFVILDQTAAQVMTISGVELDPLLYKAYLSNGSGQQLSAGWTLKFVPEQAQYT